MSTTSSPPPRVARWRGLWVAMSVGVGVEFAAGLAALLMVPLGRPSGAFPRQGRLVYDLHGAVGIGLLIGAAAIVAASRTGPRMYRIAAWIGLAGIGVGGLGGLLAADHGLRVGGIALMFVGSVIGGFAYLIGMLEPEQEAAPAIGQEPGAP